MKQLAYFVALVLVAIAASIGFGIDTHISNPEGIWIATPPADGSAVAANSFGVGFTLGATVVTAIYILGLLLVSSYRIFKRMPIRRFVFPVLAAFIIGIVLVVLGDRLSILPPVSPY